MTKVTVLGEKPKEKKLKPIEFIQYLGQDKEWAEFCCQPNEWGNIVLISKNHIDKLDLIYAYDSINEGHDSCLYLGHFNDGIVE